MVVRVRKATHRLPGVVPEQRLEQAMWVVWVPLIAAWNVLPWLAARNAQGLLALPGFALALPAYAMLRWAAVAAGLACLALTARCWMRMGKNWRMGIGLAEKGELITDSLFARVRHPIYALSIGLMLCSLIVVPTWPMLVVAVVHIGLMTLKAGNEERHLLQVHGQEYRRYMERTRRFLPWPGRRTP
jgi:protein-S-isoprenylcysteine O-methyltransferase Ste14